MGCAESKSVDKTFVVSKSSSTVAKNVSGARKALIEDEHNFVHIKQSSPSIPSTVSSRTTTVSLEVDEDDSYLLPKVDYNGHLLTEEIVRRTSSSLQCSSLSVGKGEKKIELQYAFRSQRGYNSQYPLKSNQEKYSITLNFASESGDGVIGVFSGHGENGQQCANFSQRVLPQQLAKFVRQKRVQCYTKQLKAEGKTAGKGAWNPNAWPLLNTNEFEQCCRRAFNGTNKMSHEENEVDDELSGTSAAIVCFHGGRMTVCNVGDCRVILGHRNSDGHTRSYTSFDNEEEEKEEEKCEIEEYAGYSQTHVEEQRYRPEGEVFAIPMTKDHTLLCQEELERIKRAGAEVELINQIEDTDLAFNSLNGVSSVEREESPLLLQIPGKPYTGTKFTRSIGNSMIEGIGVSSDPEVLSCDLSTNDDMLIIASNGVFEFLTNQEVIDICSASCNPLQASEDVTKAAYNKSIEHKNHCTDLTIIVCFLSSAYQPSCPEDIAVSTHSLAGDGYW